MFGHSFFGAAHYGPRYFGPGVTTPTPTPTPLQGSGNPAGPGRPHTTGNTYTDIARWTRRGTAVRVAATAVQTRRLWLHTYASIRPRRTTQAVGAVPNLALRTALPATANVKARRVRLRATGVAASSQVVTAAIARQTERQDMADMLAIIDLLEQLDGED